MQQCTKTYIPLTTPTLTTAANTTWSGWRDVGRTMIRSPTRNRTLSRRRGSAQGIHHMSQVQKFMVPYLKMYYHPSVMMLDSGQVFFNQNLQKPGAWWHPEKDTSPSPNTFYFTIFNQNLQKPGAWRHPEKNTSPSPNTFYFTIFNQNLQKPGVWWHPEKNTSPSRNTFYFTIFNQNLQMALWILCFADRASRYIHLKKNQLVAQTTA